ncbi:MAG: PSD1 domain-containing protein [Planctomycetaceae bacterium]|nr:PSD1 domain-containing protein [Planctomycetaceae bacterium]
MTSFAGCAAFFSLLIANSQALAGTSEPTTNRPMPSDEAQADNLAADDVAFFEKKIRPVLAQQCFPCHSSDNPSKQKARLSLNLREGVIHGGQSGPAVVPGKPDESLLIRAISRVDPELSMPPAKPLSEEVVADFREWVRRGAPDPRSHRNSSTVTVPAEQNGSSHWSFQRPVAPSVPEVANAEWPKSNEDRFILAALEARQLSPVRDADRAALLRRLTFDLTGLPPTVEDVVAFTRMDNPESLAQAVDRLLASPQFGEKWARHWLDVARYAESTGKTVNFAYPNAWRYRDYVIHSFNDDKPWDQFIREQLAGDLLPSDSPARAAECQIATGFLAIGPKTLNERNGLKFELDIADEQIDVTTQAFLGITVACARCHDHKFDPVSQRDYYAMSGIFRSTETCYGTVSFINAQRTSKLLSLSSDSGFVAATPPLSHDERAEIQRQIERVQESIRAMKDPVQKFLTGGQVSLLQAKLDAYEEDGTPKLLVMGVRDKAHGPEPPPRRFRFGGAGGFTYDGSRSIQDSPVYVRGEADQPQEERVPRGTVQILCNVPLSISDSTSGRLELAEWIASRDNPLTARVLVNRVWLQLFGKGLVPSSDDFGLAGQPPTHPELLDFLTVRFMDEGWSVKTLIRHLVLTHTYQLDSISNADALAVDPDNTLLWRTAPRRLTAESIRDAMLRCSGQLNLNPPAGSAVAEAGEGPVTRFRFGPDPIARALNNPDDNHRSIYLPVVRDNLPDSMELFDAADPSLITPERGQTIVPSQALYLMNNTFVLRVSRQMADELLTMPADEDRLRMAWLRCYGRGPLPAEKEKALEFVTQFSAKLQLVNSERNEREAWAALCQALFASAEFQLRR